MLEPTEEAELSLRRYKDSDKAKCDGLYGYHNASNIIGTVPYSNAIGFDGDGKLGEEFRGDPRWPEFCTCGYAFQPEDRWQDNRERLYRCPDGKLVTIRKAPPGAMWFATWYEENPGPGHTGADGRSLCVMLPDGVDWHIDGYAKDGGLWTRTGTPPNVTANPSILTNRYHGWLRDGWLEEC